MTVKTIYDFLNSFAPFIFQESWDNSGLQIGNLNNKVKKVILSLDITLDTVIEAERIGAQLILSHHPLFFKPLKNIDTSNDLLKVVIKNNITIISSHTPLDVIPEGVSFSLAKKLGLQNLKVLSPLKDKFFYKFFFNLPTGIEKKILNNLFSEGVGEYLYYENCAFETFGEGRFLVKDKKRDSFIKSLTPYREGKMEVLVRKDKIDWVINKLREIHPYDEISFDIFEEAVNPINIGYGAIGDYSSVKKLSFLIEEVKEFLGLDKVRYNGDLKKKIKTVAVVGGSGSLFIKDAIKLADVFISGDIKYHDALEYGDKISIIDIGHRASEEPVLMTLKEKMSKEFKNIEFFIYKDFGDVYKYI